MFSWLRKTYETDSLVVNAVAKQHNRVVYSSQAIHHVAQQIASLYWSSVSQDARSRDAFARGIEKTTDLSRQMWDESELISSGTRLTIWPRNITKMPVDLESPEASEEEHSRSVRKCIRIYSDWSSTCLTLVVQLPKPPRAAHEPRQSTTATTKAPWSVTAS